MSELPFTEADARATHAWFDVDRVPRDPATTAWKRSARWNQMRWREARGYPIGALPYRGGPNAMPIGSRLDLAFARESGANFVTPGALAAVRERLATPEQYQTLNEARLWADLLSSMPLCFNLFGSLAGDRVAAKRAIGTWWPEAAGADVRVRFEHSPGRRDHAYLGNQSAFDVALELDAGGGDRAIVGVETKYHEHAVAERAPKPAALARYVEVTERSDIFVEGWREQILGTDLQQVWLDHLLLLAMLQHPSAGWSWGRFVLAFPAANPSFSSVAKRYGAVLRDRRTFEARTLEELNTDEALGDSARVLRERYLAGGT